MMTQNIWADQIYRNQSGFPVCYQTNEQIYFFEWDEIVRTQNKDVFYFKLNDYIKSTNHQIAGCEERLYIHEIPLEILKPIKDIQNELPSEIFSALEQVKNGGRLYRSESTASDFIISNHNLFQANSPTQISFLRERYGDQFALNLISEWSQKLISDKASCESLIGSCDYYLCAEQKSPCGLDGYNLGFGFKYCSGSNFKLAGEMMTILGKKWIQNVFQCLQKQSFINMKNNQNSACESIKQDAFDSHSNCYAQAGFCDLKLSEKMNILKLIKAEIFSIATIEQGFALLNLCHISNQEKQMLQQQLQNGGLSEK